MPLLLVQTDPPAADPTVWRAGGGELVGQLMENWLKVVVPAVLASCEMENMPTSSVPLEPLRVAVPIWFQLVPLVE